MTATRARVFPEHIGRQLVINRANGACELCGGRGLALQWAHRRNRSHGGLWAPSNGLHLCGAGCHEWTEQNADACRIGGWRIVHDDTPSQQVPVWLIGAGGHYPRGWWLLDDDGCLNYPPDPVLDALPDVPPVLPPWVRL